jgi:hypothetical protein
MQRAHDYLWGLALMLALAGPAWSEPNSPAAAISPEAAEFFEKQVRPALVTHCYECHGEKKQRGGLRVDSREFLLQGTDNGPALVAGNPDQSRLIQAIRHEGELKMPPKGKLPGEVIDLLTAWVKQGAPWPASAVPPPGVGPKANPDAWKQHWAFQPVRLPEIPPVADAAWPRTAVDRFVLAKLEEKGIAPSPAADRRTFLRRVTYDLIGLPATAAEIDAFVQDSSAEAFAKVVDRLLASPHYGERWGRYWLDVSRYADTKGYVFQEDRNYPDAFKYRDWVIRAINEDLPYDQFLLKQIAADQLPPEEENRSLAAMGFLTLGRRFINNTHDIIDDRIDVVTRGTLGLTVTCARCHDHKFDPIPTEDYYSLYGVFISSQEPKDAPSPLRLVDAPNPHNVQVFLRGNPANRGREAPRRFLLALAGENRQPFQKGSGRLELAQAIANSENPLTARVLVNRVWAQHFGTGLVRTPSDFGVRCEPPSHPALLDYLARTFMDGGWSLKALHRQIVLSSVYQQRSDDRPEALGLDPDNVLLWKMNRRRLDFEALRDSLLAATGQLDETVGGPAAPLTTEPFSVRRTVYGFIDRQNLPGLFRTFDFANPDTHSPGRFITTVPQQALFLMNSPFVMQGAERVQQRPELAGIADPAQRIHRLYALIYGRDPTAAETSLGLAFIEANSTPAGSEPPESSDTWQFGFGEFDETSERIPHFQPLPHWTGTAWQGGPALPDPTIGWVILNADGGHPGNDLQHAAIRRWIAPQDGTVKIRGKLKHTNAEGDGVQGRIVSSRSGVAGQGTAQNGESAIKVERLEVKQGDTLDFVADCRTSPNHDSFTWTINLRLDPPAAGGRLEWNSNTDFHGPTPKLLSVWERYAQALLLTNEFVFVD